MNQPLMEKYHKRQPLDQQIQAAVLRVLQSGRLYRYDVDETQPAEASLLEKEFAAYIGATYAVAVASCTAALNIALYTLEIGPGDVVLIPAFTFIAVPSAVKQSGASVKLVEVTDDYYLDVNDLKKKINPKTKVLILSHMRGQVGNLDEIARICQQQGVQIIEDCAHTLGMRWQQQPIGRHGIIACYSMQSYKMIDAGEGGMFVTDDPILCAKAIIYAGAYERLWQSHLMRPQEMSALEKKIPCVNARMSNLTAAVIRAQLPDMARRVTHHNHHYELLVALLTQSPHIYVPKREKALSIAADSIQFRLQGVTWVEKNDFYARVKLGLPLNNFDGDNARCFWNWHFLGEIDACEKTRKLLQFTFDLKLPSCLDDQDIRAIADIILSAVKAVKVREIAEMVA